MIKLFVVGFPREMDEMQLAQLFGPHGDIELLTIVRDKFTQHSKGFGFVQMKDMEGAQLAIEALDGMAFGDRTLEVRIAEDKPAPVPPVRRPVAMPRHQQQPPQPIAVEKKKRPRLSR
ncbi:MAG: RNA-binding protein [Bacteroidota bacterium]